MTALGLTYQDVNVYLINLDRSPERLNQITKQLLTLEVPFERVAAFDASKEDLSLCQIDRQIFAKVHGRTRVRDAEIGCHQSHILALDRFIKSDKKFAVVFEDDIQIGEGLNGVLDQLKVWSAEWDIVPLFHWHRGTPIRIKHSGHFSLNVFLTAVTSSAAYVVNRHAAKVLLTHIKVQSACVDHELFDTASHGLRLRGITPKCISLSAQANVSTIGASNPNSDLKPSFWKRIPTLVYRSRYAAFRLFSGVFDALKSR
jgi:glycosyl transferase, family 25